MSEGFLGSVYLVLTPLIDVISILSKTIPKDTSRSSLFLLLQQYTVQFQTQVSSNGTWASLCFLGLWHGTNTHTSTDDRAVVKANLIKINTMQIKFKVRNNDLQREIFHWRQVTYIIIFKETVLSKPRLQHYPWFVPVTVSCLPFLDTTMFVVNNKLGRTIKWE